MVTRNKSRVNHKPLLTLLFNVEAEGLLLPLLSLLNWDLSRGTTVGVRGREALSHCSCSISSSSAAQDVYAFPRCCLWVFDCWNLIVIFAFGLNKGSDDEDEGQKVPPPPETPMPPPLPPTPDQVIVRKDYDPKGKSGW